MHADKNQENKRRVASNRSNAGQVKNDQKHNASASQLVDNSSEAIQIPKLQEIANNLAKLKSLQFVNNQPEVVQMKQPKFYKKKGKERSSKIYTN